jgi:hypothetical protein
MSSDNVIPIRSGDGKPPDTPRSPAPKARKPAKIKGLLLEESDEFDGFSTYEVLAALRGVCCAFADLDYSSDMDVDFVERLAIAAKVLSSTLHTRAG